mgnify:CR=1 FL=1
MRRKEISTISSMRRVERNSVLRIRKDWRHSSPKSKRKLAESLLKEEEKRPDRWRRREEAPVPVVSPDKKWEAYVKDNNLYLSPLWDEKEKDKPKEEIALTMDGTANLRYDGWSIIWSPDSRKLATVKVRDVQERRIPLIDPARLARSSRSCNGATMRSRGMYCLFTCRCSSMWRRASKWR